MINIPICTCALTEILKLYFCHWFGIDYAVIWKPTDRHRCVNKAPFPSLATQSTTEAPYRVQIAEQIVEQIVPLGYSHCHQEADWLLIGSYSPRCALRC